MYDKSEITQVDATRLLKEYKTILEKISKAVKNSNDTRLSRADIHFIPLLLIALRAISKGEEKIEYRGTEYEGTQLYAKLGGISGLGYQDFNDKTPHEVLNNLWKFHNRQDRLYLCMCNKYVLDQSEKNKAGLFFWYLCNPEQISLNEQLDSQILPDDYFSIKNYESEDEDSQSEYTLINNSGEDFNNNNSNVKAENSPLISTNTTISASLFWQFVDFIEDNQKIIIAAALVTFAIAGLIVLTIGTGGLGLLGASAATAIAYIGVTGVTAFATIVVGAVVATASIAGLVGMGIFSCVNEEPSCKNSEIENQLG